MDLSHLFVAIVFSALGYFACLLQWIINAMRRDDGRRDIDT